MRKKQSLILMKRTFWLISCLALLTTYGCHQGNTYEGKPVEQAAPMKVTMHRYEKDLFSIDKSNLKAEIVRLMPRYPLFLGNTPPDTVSLMKMSDYLNDTLIQAVYRETLKVYPNLDSVETELGQAFANYRKVLPGINTPTVYTYVSGLDYENPIRITDSVMIVALDMYLGEHCRFYSQAGIPQFRCLGFTQSYIVPDIMKELVFSQLPQENKNRNLLEWMIFYGKMMYSLDLVIPDAPDYRKITYTPEQIKWCKDNEAKIWGYFIANKLLFSTDSKQIMNFIPDAPFTKGLDKESPGRIGWWVGWQIVRKFMENNPAVTLPQLFQMTDAQAILKKSGYKPEK